MSGKEPEEVERSPEAIAVSERLAARRHQWGWFAQDWRTSSLRMHSIMTGEPDLRTVYFEALNALQEMEFLPTDTEALVAILGCPQDMIEKHLPTILKFGKKKNSRGGLMIVNGGLVNRRIQEDRALYKEFIEKARENGRRGGKAKHKRDEDMGDLDRASRRSR